PRSERGDAFARTRLALLAIVAPGEAERLVVVGPRRRRLAFTLVARGQVQQRSSARIETLALGELRAGLGVALLRHELARFLEQRLRDRDIVGICARLERSQRAGRDQREGEEEPARSRAHLRSDHSSPSVRGLGLGWGEAGAVGRAAPTRGLCAET